MHCISMPLDCMLHKIYMHQVHISLCVRRGQSFSWYCQYSLALNFTALVAGVPWVQQPRATLNTGITLWMCTVYAQSGMKWVAMPSTRSVCKGEHWALSVLHEPMSSRQQLHRYRCPCCSMSEVLAEVGKEYGIQVLTLSCPWKLFLAKISKSTASWDPENHKADNVLQSTHVFSMQILCHW